jgi:hypothetical protein
LLRIFAAVSRFGHDNLQRHPDRLSHDSAPSLGAAIPGILDADLDDRTVAYAIAMRGSFDDLRRAAAQLAGLLVLTAAGSRQATPDHPMLVLACKTYDQAADSIRTASAPTQGEHHHRHLTRAALWIGRALTRARDGARPAGTLDVDETLVLLRRGWQELQWTSGTLPGFEIVAFDQACCTHHARAAAVSADTSTA